MRRRDAAALMALAVLAGAALAGVFADALVGALLCLLLRLG